MSTDWGRVTEIVANAAELPPAEREAYLREACAGDPELEREVRSLLTHHRTDAFLEAGGGAREVASLARGASDEAPQAGQRIGTWRLVRAIGEGGMGVVWLVERADGQFTQHGALKLIRIGFATEEMVRRFRRERQILAALQHPNIARLIDGGSTSEGMPFLVMEHIEGVPLHAYCSEHLATVNERLKIFLALCSAVEYAHQRLVLHRDLKPGNVLVTADGVPQLLDFGVAKIVDETAGGANGLRTVTVPFTPEYASPEQLDGLPATTASDLYSLGVLLYELLTGAHPFSSERLTPVELIRAVRETDPERPSMRVTRIPGEDAASRSGPRAPEDGGSALRRRLEGDLDTIVLKALQKDPARRYASVAQLAEDVRRHLAGQPVLARPDSLRYRAAKFARRNRVAISLGALAVVALIAGLAAALWQAAAARRESAIATRHLHEVQALANTLLFDVFDGIQDMPGATAVRTEVVRKATQFLDGLAGEAGRDSAVRFSLASAYERLGDAQTTVLEGDPRRSLEHAQQLYERLLVDYPGNEHATLGLIVVDSRLGGLDELESRNPEALVLMRKAADLNDALVRAHPEVESYRIGSYKRANNLANALLFNQRYAEVLPPIRAAIAGFREVAAREPANAEWRRMLGMTSTVCSEAVFNVPGGLDSALALEKRALGYYLEAHRMQPQRIELELRVADGHARLGSLYQATGEADSAIANLELAQAIAQHVAASDPADQRLAVQVASSQVGLALVWARRGETTRAVAWLERARPALRHWWLAGTRDVNLIGTHLGAELSEALIAASRARTSTGSESRSWWERSRATADSALADVRSDSTVVRQLEGVDAGALLAQITARADSALGRTPKP